MIGASIELGTQFAMVRYLQWSSAVPMAYKINSEHKIVISTGNGTLTFAESLTHQENLREDPNFIPKFSQLMDLTLVTKMELKSDELQRLAAHSVFANDSRRSFLVSSDLAYGLFRMFQTFRNNEGENGIQIFRELGPALNWVHLTTSSREQIRVSPSNLRICRSSD